MNSNRRPKTLSLRSVYGNEKGIVLPVALMLLAVLSVMGGAAVAITRTDLKIAKYYKSGTVAFALAEAGIEHARKALMSLDPTAVLIGTSNVFSGGNIGSLGGGGGTYSIQVMNNIGSEGFPRGEGGMIQADSTTGPCNPSSTKDCDRILLIRSTGTWGGSEKKVEAVIRNPLRFTAAVYLMDGTDLGGPVEIEDFESPSTIKGEDCNPPTLGGGPGPETTPAVGIALQTGTKQQIEGDIGLDNPRVTGVSGGPGDIQANVPGMMSDAEFKFWVQGLIADATPVGTGLCGGPGSSQTYGTWANPQICHATVNTVPNELPQQIPANSRGAGIFIINDFDPRLGSTGLGQEVTNFTYEGIVIVLGDGRFRMQGNSKIYGSLIQKNIKGNHSGETRLRMRDDSDICYSSAAVDLILDQRKANIIAWYEVQ